MAEVDPRFDPVFQRGYDPQKHGAPKRRARPPRVEDERVETPATAPRDERTPPAAAPVEQPEADEEAPRGRNPFRIALLLTSLGSIALSAYLLYLQLTRDPLQQYYGNNTGRVFWGQFVDSLMIPLLTAGFLGLILWLALGAVARSRR
jgi:hypothetical protein